MNLDALKKQAGRLAAYMGAKHRVNLKHASALEALAAIHGARNWQTLAASAEHADEPNASVSPASSGAMTMSWHSTGLPHLSLPRSRWLRHAIAFGDTASGWLFDSVAEAAESGCVALLLAYPDTLVGTPPEAAGHPVRFVDESETSVASLLQSLAGPGVIVVSVSSQTGWCELLREVIQTRGRTGPAMVVGLPEFDAMSSAELIQLLRIAEQGRAFGVTLRSAARDSRRLRHMTHGTAYLANMTHQLYLPSAKGEAREEVLSRFENAPAICLSDTECQF